MNHNRTRMVLTGLSCAGVVASMIFSGKNTLKADEIRRKEKLIDQKTIVKKTAHCFVPAMICGGATIVAILINQHLATKCMAGIVGAAGASTRFYREFESKARDILGDMKVDEVHRAIAHDHENKIVQAAIPDIYAPGLVSCVCDPTIEGYMLFYDEFTDIWFRSSFAAVKNAEYHLNRNYVLGDRITLPRFYEFLGVGLPPEYHELNWDDILLNDGIPWLDFYHIESFSKDKNEKYLIIRYEYPPVLGMNSDGEFEFFKKR